MSTIIGVLGDGPTTRKNTYALLDDFHADPMDKILVPGTPDLFTDAARLVADWAESHQVPFQILVTMDQATDHLDDYDLETVALTNNDPQAAVIKDSNHLFIAWDNDKESQYTTIAEVALRGGSKVYDLTDGLYPISLGENAPAAPLSTSKPEVAAPAPAAIAAPEEPAQPPAEAPATAPTAAADEGQQLDPENAPQYSKKPEGLSDSDVERILAELVPRIISAIVPLVIKDVCEALAVAFANATV